MMKRVETLKIQTILEILKTINTLVGGKGFSSEDVKSPDFEPLASGTFCMCHRIPVGDNKVFTPLPNPESYHSSHYGN